MWRIPVACPIVGKEEIENVNKALASGRVSRGEMVDEFETKFSERCEVKYGIAVNSGTSALMVILRAMDIGSDSEVITTPLTCTATLNAIALVGARPVLVDVDNDSLNITPALVKAAITSKTKAILAVHMFGTPCEMDQLKDVSSGVPIIEDACISLGSSINDVQCGGLGEAAAFSFYANKHISTGEGGMIVTNNASLHMKMRSICNLGKAPEGRHVHDYIGYNCKMTELQGALGLAQLEKLDWMISRRREILQKLQLKLLGKSGLFVGPKDKSCVFISPFAAFVILQNASDKEAMTRHLDSNMIESRPLMSFIPDEKAFHEYSFNADKYPNAKSIHERGIYVSLSPSLTDEDVTFLANTLKNFGS